MSVSKFALVAIAVGVGAAPAGAAITTFATFSSATSTDNVRFVNTGNSAGRSTDATFYTTHTATSTTPGFSLVNFSFLEPQFLPYVTNVKADFTLSGSIAKGSPTQAVGGFLVQPGASGSFSFISTTAITVGGPNFVSHVYPIGSNLLSGVFTTGDIAGQTSSGSLSDSSVSPGSTVTFTSDFLDFTPTIERDLSIALTAIIPSLAPSPGPVNKALKSFRAVAGGQFSSDPAPLINGLAIVPEPGMWVLMVAGFGLVGISARRRGRTVAA
jgi:hypothetical protein